MTAQEHTVELDNMFEYTHGELIAERKANGFDISVESFLDEAAIGEEISEAQAEDVIANYPEVERTAEVTMENFSVLAESLESLYLNIKLSGGMESIDGELAGLIDESIAVGWGGKSVKVGTEVAGIATLAVIVAALWKSIKAIVDSILAHVKELLKAIDRTIPKLIGDFEYAAKMIAKIQGLPSNNRPIPLGPEARYLMCEGYDTFNNSDELAMAMEEFTNAGKWLLTEYAAELVDVGLGIYNGLTDFNLNDPVRGLERLDSEVARRCASVIPLDLVYRHVGKPSPVGQFIRHFDMERAPSPRHTDGAYRSKAFLGNYRFFLSEKPVDLKKEKTKPSVLLDSLSYQGAIVDFYPDAIFDTYRQPTRYEISTPLKLQHVLQNCDNGIRLCKYIKEFHMPKLLGRIDLSIKAIEKRSVEMNTKVEQMEEYSQDAIAHYRAALTYNTAYTQWLNRPISGYMAHSINVCRAVLLVCNKTIASYLSK